MDRLQLDELEGLLGKEGVEHMKQVQIEAAKGLRQDAACCEETKHSCDGSDDMLKVKIQLGVALLALKIAKPEERSELSRRFAICITEMEKVYAYFSQYICDCSLGEAT